MTLGEGGGDQSPPPHALSGSLIANMFQDGLEEWITEAVVLAPGEAVLFFDDDYSRKGFLLVMQRMFDSTWVTQSIGPEEGLKWKQQ